MKEPKRIPLDPETPKTYQPNLIKLEPLIKHLYDDFGYITSIDNTNENSEKSTETELRQIQS
jgi:hypothetical protein